MEILVVLAVLAGVTAVIMGCIRGNLFATIFVTLALSLVVMACLGSDNGAVGVCFLLIWGAWMARIFRRNTYD